VSPASLLVEASVIPNLIERLVTHREAPMEECNVKLIRRSTAAQSNTQPQPSSASTIYLFYEKASGTAHFHVEAGPDGGLPVDHAAGLLAMHCMVRGQCPSDYLIMVPTAPENLGELTEKAQHLLNAGQSVKASVKLTRRENEVLDGVLRSLANKEIASELNLSERTVKFHVSSLLSKFKVHSRMELMREASQPSLRPAALAPVEQPAQNVRPFSRSTQMPGKVLNSSKVFPLPRHHMLA
jgi:DNA-binding NarL/FixJ family response regulator